MASLRPITTDITLPKGIMGLGAVLTTLFSRQVLWRGLSLIRNDPTRREACWVFFSHRKIEFVPKA